jgi:hypothetical protein
MQQNDGGYRWRSPIPINSNIGRLIMNIYQIAIVALLSMLAISLFLLWETQKIGEWFRKAWMRDSAELLNWKRNGIMRDKRTGRYHKKGES